MYRYIVTSPGQGVQKPGMLDPWLGLPSAPGLVARWSELIGGDLVAASRDEAALRDTAVAQPVIIAAALLSLRLVRETIDISGEHALFAGHSVGELAAAAGSGYLSDDSALVLADARGRAMSLACATSSTGMAAVVPAKRAGASDEEIQEKTAAAGLSVANHNGSHQFVVAGPLAAIEEFEASRPDGIRIMKLDVAGAFHTSAMAAATAPFAEAVASCPVSAPSSPMLGNRDGAVVAGPEDLRERLVAQISSPVRWDLCSATITAAADADTVFLELAPGGTLTRLVERSGAGLRTVSLRTPEDVAQLSGQFV
ncbi:MAG: ACP S-malonyltransferase [Segniliparus sp.]|uniref:ACP S-malonyltransferase n=1 Tax=Segniliparus sp. TaxID=2804064 RepID=UPI003F40E214